MRKQWLILILLLPICLWSLSLEEAIEMAKAHNKELQAIREEIGYAENDYRDIKGQLYPQINLNAGYQLTHTRTPDAFLSPTPDFTDNLADDASASDSVLAGSLQGIYNGMAPSESQDEYSLFGQVQLNQVLYMGGKLMAGIRAAKKAEILQEKRYFVKEQEVVFAVKKMFYQTLLAQKALEIAEEAYSVADQHRQQVEEMYEAGLVSEFDLLRAQIETANLEPQVTAANNNLELARESFMKQIGWEEQAPELEGEILFSHTLYSESFGLEQALQEGLQQRKELELSGITRDLYEIQYSAERGNFLPNLFLNAEYNQFSTDDKISFKGENFGSSYKIGVVMSMPLFTGFSNRSKQLKAKHQWQKSNIDYQNTENLIELDIRQSYLNYHHCIEDLAAKEKNVELAEKALRIAESRYENRVGIQLEVFDAQLQLRSARLNYLQASYAAIIAQEQLSKALGRKL